MPSLERHPQQPPCSAWAEELIVSDCLRDEAIVDQVGAIGPELQFPEFRVMWRAMQCARRRQPAAGDWYGAVHAELEQAECGGVHDEHWYAAMRTERGHGLGIDHPLSGWWGCKAKRLLALLHGGSQVPGELALALRLLHRCTEARRLVSAAHELAARAWRGDTEGALAMGRTLQPRQQEEAPSDW